MRSKNRAPRRSSCFLVPEKVDNLRDALYELRCSAEDIATAADEGISVEDMKELCAELVSLAKKIERLR
ncbi:hypothetical protein BXA20_08275 [Corynebacterium diphtheriae]|nr:hypothetical protein BXA20_08275 [Corynebacterium diphtheriae]